MKTAVSIPDELYTQADQLAKRKHWSRSRLYAEALARLVDAESKREITAKLDQVYSQVDSTLPEDIQAARNRAVADDAW